MRTSGARCLRQAQRGFRIRNTPQLQRAPPHPEPSQILLLLTGLHGPYTKRLTVSDAGHHGYGVLTFSSTVSHNLSHSTQQYRSPAVDGVRGELAPLPIRRSRAICGVSTGGRLPEDPPLPPLHHVQVPGS